MNLPTIIIAAVLAALFGLAIWRVIRKGTCAGCEKADSCPACSHCAYQSQCGASEKEHTAEPKAKAG